MSGAAVTTRRARDLTAHEYAAALSRHGMTCEGFAGYVKYGGHSWCPSGSTLRARLASAIRRVEAERCEWEAVAHNEEKIRRAIRKHNARRRRSEKVASYLTHLLLKKNFATQGGAS